jgi:hypothetical protein
MKLAALAAGTFLALAVSGPAVVNTHTVQVAASDIVTPAWMPLPSRPFISSIEYAGEAGVEAAFGTIIYSLPTDGASEVNWLTAHLAGSRLLPSTTAPRRSTISPGPIPSSAPATSPAAGASIIVNTIRMDGATLRLTFEDPQAGAYVSLL